VCEGDSSVDGNWMLDKGSALASGELFGIATTYLWCSAAKRLVDPAFRPRQSFQANRDILLVMWKIQE